ncbi:MAG: hypothetical protein LAT63_08645 [Marinobacter sp.]|nr:hypothetical protein [Marinobacter sp.]
MSPSNDWTARVWQGVTGRNGQGTGYRPATGAGKLCGLLLPWLLLVGCDPGTPYRDNEPVFTAAGAAAPLSDSEFRQLTPEQQYQVANKLSASFYRGVPVDEFFDLSAGMNRLQPRDSRYLSNTAQALRTPLQPARRQALRDRIGLNPDDTPVYGADDLFEFAGIGNENTTHLHKQLPLAQITAFPLSRDLFVEWTAYFLTNTIMFSPALEMESTDAKDAGFIYNYLRNSIRDQVPVRDIVRQYLGTQSRWRVSRSAENHALEAYELFLGLFDTEEDSRRGGTACQDWRLTPESAAYQLVRSGEPNRTYQRVLDRYYILDCSDLYNVIVSHPLFMPRVTEVIVNYFLPELDVQRRLAFVQAVVAANPTTFEDIFSAVIFSREYLLNSERPKWFEENMFGSLHRLRWSLERNQGDIGRRILRRLQEPSGAALSQYAMGSAAMEYKIGRTPQVPMDTLSFSSQAKAMREQVYIVNRNGWLGGEFSGGAKGFRGLLFEAVPREDNPELMRTVLRPELQTMTAAEFIDYLFLSSLMRRATPDERAALVDMMRTDDGSAGLDYIRLIDGELRVRPNSINFYRDITQVVFEYVTRLPEFYYVRRVGS